MEYPNTLKETRQSKGLTQKQVADYLHLKCEDRISHWERGVSYPSLLNLISLLILYEVSLETLYPILFIKMRTTVLVGINAKDT
jgi:transcriptional regulator with XRE-family HTH domain